MEGGEEETHQSMEVRERSFHALRDQLGFANEEASAMHTPRTHCVRQCTIHQRGHLHLHLAGHRVCHAKHGAVPCAQRQHLGEPVARPCGHLEALRARSAGLGGVVADGDVPARHKTVTRSNISHSVSSVACFTWVAVQSMRAFAAAAGGGGTRDTLAFTHQKGHAALLTHVDSTARDDTEASITMRAKGMVVVVVDRGLWMAKDTVSSALEDRARALLPAVRSEYLPHVNNTSIADAHTDRCQQASM